MLMGKEAMRRQGRVLEGEVQAWSPGRMGAHQVNTWRERRHSGGTGNRLCKGLEWVGKNVGFSGNWKLLSMAVAQSLSEGLEEVGGGWGREGPDYIGLHRGLDAYLNTASISPSPGNRLQFSFGTYRPPTTLSPGSGRADLIT